MNQVFTICIVVLFETTVLINGTDSYGSDSSLSGSDCSSSEEVPTCDVGWEEFNGHCYLFSTDLQFWQDAKATCEGYSSTLVKIEDSAENTWLIERIIANGLTSTHAWIGADDLDRDGVWRWLDGEAFTYTAWAPNQPSGDGKCVGFRFDDGWNDRNCDRAASFICEKPL